MPYESLAVIVSWSVWPAATAPPEASETAKCITAACVTVIPLVASDRLPAGRLLSVAVIVFAPPATVASVKPNVWTPLSGEPPEVVYV